jgi:hypothetical protein
MKSNKTYILLAVFIVLAVITYFVVGERGEKTTTYKLEKQLFAVDSALTDKIEIEKNGKRIELSKSGMDWRITQPVDYSAYQQFIASMLSNLKNYKLESKVSDNPENKDKFGFNDTNVTKISVYQAGTLKGSFLIGNATNAPSQTYIKKLEGNEIFLADNFLRNNFVKGDMNEFRDKQITAIPRNSINSIEFVSETDNYTITRDTTGKYFSGKDSVSAGVSDGVFSILQNLNTQGFRDTIVGNDIKYDYIMKLQSNKPIEIDFWKVGEGTNPKYLLKITDNKQIFEVDENFVKSLFKSKKEMLGIK